MMNYAIIVAGGTGSRMGTDVPKQFLLLGGIPVMMHAIQAFSRSTYRPAIIVVLPPSLRNRWMDLCHAHDFQVPHTLMDSGLTRFSSVKTGLSAVASQTADLSQTLIAIHDAARPLITPALIDKTYLHAEKTGAAALALQSTSSIRIKSNNGLKTNAHPREQVYLMQTPQTFNGAMLQAAYEQPETTYFTDDASVIEKKGYPITLVDGDTRNIKITFPEDLSVATLLLRSGGVMPHSE